MHGTVALIVKSIVNYQARTAIFTINGQKFNAHSLLLAAKLINNTLEFLAIRTIKNNNSSVALNLLKHERKVEIPLSRTLCNN